MRFKLMSKACPHCGGTERYPSARSRKWRPLIFMRGYSCRICHSQYIVLFGLFSRLVERGFKPSKTPVSKNEAAMYSDSEK